MSSLTAPNVGDDVLELIEEHVWSDTGREVGGFLVGRLPDHEPAHVIAAIPALKAVGHRANVTFTYEVWADVLDRVERDFPGSRIVGWYHSHPGFGLFLSDYDQFIHENFFGDLRMVALVVDPHAGRQGWFMRRDDRFVQLGESRTGRRAVSPPGGPVDARPATRPPALALAAIALLIAGMGIGYALAGYSGAAPQQAGVVESAGAAAGRAERPRPTPRHQPPSPPHGCGSADNDGPHRDGARFPAAFPGPASVPSCGPPGVDRRGRPRPGDQSPRTHDNRPRPGQGAQKNEAGKSSERQS